MRTSVLITSALAAGAMAAPQRLAARTFFGDGDVCKSDSCFGKLLEKLHLEPDFCWKFELDAVASPLGAFASFEVQSACSCVNHILTGTASGKGLPTGIPTMPAHSGHPAPPQVTGPAPPQITVPTDMPTGFLTSTPAVPTVAPGTSTRKCKAPKPEATHAEPTVPVPTITSFPKPTGPAGPDHPAGPMPGLTLSTSLGLTIPSIPKPTGTASGSSCPKPELSGGDFGILGSLSGNAGMWLESLTGSCGAKVFGLGSAGSWGAAGTAQFSSGSGSIARRTVGDDEKFGSLSLSGSLANLVGEGKNFLQLTGHSGQTASQSVCQKTTLCKGQQYTMSVGAACDMGPDALLQFTAGAGVLTSEVNHLVGGVKHEAAFEWSFTWGGETGLIDLCALTTIVQDLQSVGLWDMKISALF